MNIAQPIRLATRKLYLGPVNIAIGLALSFGIGTLWPNITEVFWDAYYVRNPIVVADIGVVEKTPDAIYVDVLIRKIEDCDLVSRYALAKLRGHGGESVRVRAERVDGLPLGYLEPGQKLRSRWKIHPLYDAEKYEVRMKFSCSGRTQITKVLEIPG